MDRILSYNGVQLPPIPDYDTKKYPYVFIGHLINENPALSTPTIRYQIFAYDKPLVPDIENENYVNGFYLPEGASYIYSFTVSNDDVSAFSDYYSVDTISAKSYVIFEKSLTVDYNLSRQLIWTNVDIYYDEDKLFLAATEPVEPTVSIKNITLTTIADAIRSKNHKDTMYKPSEMSKAIKELADGLPLKYQEYVDYAKENLYDGDYENLMVWDYGDWLAVSFLMKDFKIYTFDPNTTEVTASGWVTCGYTKSTGEWTVNDYSILTSPGGNYAKHIAYSSCYIYHGNAVLYPVGVNNFIKVTDISYRELTDTLKVTTTTGYVEQLNISYGTQGNVIAITDSKGNVITVSGI